MADMIFTDVDISPNPVKATGVYKIAVGVEEEEKVAFAVFDSTDGSLIFYSDEKTPEVGSTYKGQVVSKIYTGVEDTGTSYSTTPWYSDRTGMKLVKFDKSFATVRINTMIGWFYGFSNCTSIDLSNLNTSKVVDMRHLFNNCGTLTTLDLTPMDTSNVTNMSHMFEYCNGLTTLDLTPMDTSNVTNMSNMFYNCSDLTVLDLTPMDTNNVTNMSYMFMTCNFLETIYSDDSKFKVDKVTSGAYMFTSCSKLVGGAGTAYDSSKVTYEMAHVDTEANPGYFTAKAT